jgi:hypothetical protein
MPEFLAETYAPPAPPGTAVPSAAGAAAAGQASHPGAPVRLMSATAVPGSIQPSRRAARPEPAP